MVFIQFKIIDMILKFVLDFAHLFFDFSESIFIFGMEFCFGMEFVLLILLLLSDFLIPFSPFLSNKLLKILILFFVFLLKI